MHAFVYSKQFLHCGTTFSEQRKIYHSWHFLCWISKRDIVKQLEEFLKLPPGDYLSVRRFGVCLYKISTEQAKKPWDELPWAQFTQSFPLISKSTDLFQWWIVASIKTKICETVLFFSILCVCFFFAYLYCVCAWSIFSVFSWNCRYNVVIFMVVS